MKSIIVALCFVAAATAAVIPTNNRLRRDVSEVVADPAYNYLPPNEKLDLPTNNEPEAPELEPEVAPEQVIQEEQEPEPTEIAVNTEEEAPQESAVLGDNGYEYKTVRRLRFRSRRDVSHLNLEYLPPVAAPEPSREYLPPVEEAPAPKISNEYLPPVVEEEPEPEPETEAPATEVPAVETEAPEVVTEPATETPAEVLADDGYHYKQPAVVPDLGPIPEPVTREYLPPLEEGIVEAEGPAEDTAVLADDGYHYRAIKRVRF